MAVEADSTAQRSVWLSVMMPRSPVKHRNDSVGGTVWPRIPSSSPGGSGWLQDGSGRDIDDVAPASADDEEVDEHEGETDGELFGFLTCHSVDAENAPLPRFTFADADDDYPETWLDYDAAGNPRLKSHYRAARARRLLLEPSGDRRRNGWVVSPRKVPFLPAVRRDAGWCGQRSQSVGVIVGRRT
jgi:hypothetical protein